MVYILKISRCHSVKNKRKTHRPDRSGNCFVYQLQSFWAGIQNPESTLVWNRQTDIRARILVHFFFSFIFASWNFPDLNYVGLRCVWKLFSMSKVHCNLYGELCFNWPVWIFPHDFPQPWISAPRLPPSQLHRQNKTSDREFRKILPPSRVFLVFPDFSS